MTFIKDNPKIVLLVAVLCCVLASIFFVSPYGFTAVLLSGGIVCSWVLMGWEYNSVAKCLAAGVVLVGVFGAFVENPQRRETASVLDLTLEAYTQPGNFGFDSEDTEELYRTVRICGFQGVNDIASLARDLTAAKYEPAELSIVSWMWKRPADRETCLERAKTHVQKSPTFAVRLKAIVDENS